MDTGTAMVMDTGTAMVLMNKRKVINKKDVFDF